MWWIIEMAPASWGRRLLPGCVRSDACVIAVSSAPSSCTGHTSSNSGNADALLSALSEPLVGRARWNSEGGPPGGANYSTYESSKTVNLYDGDQCSGKK